MQVICGGSEDGVGKDNNNIDRLAAVLQVHTAFQFLATHAPFGRQHKLHTIYATSF
jgi:hypothetical protein